MWTHQMHVISEVGGMRIKGAPIGARSDDVAMVLQVSL